MPNARLLNSVILLALCCLPIRASMAEVTPTTGPTVESSPLLDELHTRFNVGDYTGVLRTVAHALSQGEKGMQGVSKHTLLLMRAESELRLKQTDAAATAFREASKATDDPHTSALDAATALLVVRSRQLKYTPRTSPVADHKQGNNILVSVNLSSRVIRGGGRGPTSHGTIEPNRSSAYRVPRNGYRRPTSSDCPV
jgi:hypothetical protein